MRARAGRLSFPRTFACLPWCWRLLRDVLANRICSCASAIAATAEQLLLPNASSPIARRFPGQPPERCSEGCLRGIAKRRCDRHDRCVSVAQHVHGLLEPVLAQPGMRRKPGAFLEGAAEMEARQADLRSQRCERYVRITVRAQALD